jgi:hypothetical protein
MFVNNPSHKYIFYKNFQQNFCFQKWQVKFKETNVIIPEFNPIDYLETQMSTLISSAETFPGIQFEKNVILSRRIEGPSTTLDCLNECVNVVNRICQFFVFRDGVCYIGRNDIEQNNTQTFPIVTVYFVKGRKNFMLKNTFIKSDYEYSTSCLLNCL